MTKIKSGYYKGLSKKQAQAYRTRKEKTARYKTYTELYDKKQKELAKKGIPMYDTKLSKSQFDLVYRQYHQLQKQGNITQKIVRDQTYEFSNKQMKAYHDAAKAMGYTITYYEMQALGPTAVHVLTEDIKRVRNALRAKGYSADEVSHFIRTEYFGSPS